jgi:adenosylcobinamide-GDP ribazoletransferase
VAVGLAAVVALTQVVTGLLAWAAVLIAAALAAAGVPLLVTRTADRRLGGTTGDVLGAIAELSTAAALLAIALA